VDILNGTHSDYCGQASTIFMCEAHSTTKKCRAWISNFEMEEECIYRRSFYFDIAFRFSPKILFFAYLRYYQKRISPLRNVPFCVVLYMGKIYRLGQTSMSTIQKSKYSNHVQRRNSSLSTNTQYNDLQVLIISDIIISLSTSRHRGPKLLRVWTNEKYIATGRMVRARTSRLLQSD
jgi:hypothetical protein